MSFTKIRSLFRTGGKLKVYLFSQIDSFGYDKQVDWVGNMVYWEKTELSLNFSPQQGFFFFFLPEASIF